MAITIDPKNNFANFKKDFTADTKLKPEEHMAEYIAYYQGRASDSLYQMHFQIANVLLNEIAAIKEKIGIKPTQG